MKKLLVALVSLTMAMGCGSPKDENGDGVADGVVSPGNVTTVTPATPVSTVSGQVLTTKFAPIEGGVTVNLTLGGRGDGSAAFYTTTSDATGNFSFKNVPAGGNAQLTYSKMGFGTVRTNVQIPTGYGNVPVSNANANAGVVLLNALTATVKFHVFTRSGRPATGSKAIFEVSPAGFVGYGNNTYGDGLGVVSVEGTVDDSGTLTLAGVPDPAELARVNTFTGSNYTLVLSGIDANNDGWYDFNGTVAQWSGREFYENGSSTPIILDDARQSQPLQILATNVHSLTSGMTSPLRNVLKGSDKIYVLFNQPVLPGTSLVVKVVQEDCATNAAQTFELGSNNTLLTITPGAMWGNGAKYSIVIRATAAETTTIGNTVAYNGYFFGGDPAAPKAVTAATFTGKKAAGSMGSLTSLMNGDTLYVNFDTPVRNIGGATARVFFNYDLDSSGTTGQAGETGETGAGFNFGLLTSISEVASDTNNTFACTASGYSSRWQVALPGNVLPVGGVPSGTAMKIIFSKSTSTSDGFQTIWGVPVLPTNAELTGTLAVSQ